MRPSGRKPDQLRKLKLTPRISRHAEGSCLIECGGTKVLCTASVESGVPHFLRNTGKGWVTAKDASGQRRLDDPADFVRVETATALRRDIPLIPVLVQGASTPKPGDLPDDLKDLAYRNAMEITHARWDSDVQLLIKALRTFVPATPAQPTIGQIPRPTVGAGSKKKWSAKQIGLLAAILPTVIGIMLYLASSRKPGETGRADSNAAVPPQTGAAEKTAIPNPNDKPAAENPTVPNFKQMQNVANAPAFPAAASAVLAQQLSLGAEAKTLPQKDANGNPRYYFTLSVKAAPSALASISRVHYDLVYESNPLSLDGGPAPDFSASYEGWGCYRKVVVTAYFSTPGQKPVERTFDMCNALNW